ncbi:SDR family oxidoreductase [Bradyrhizobium sp. ISRA443]|uniref:SDR family oxidoreductase n=1 Tax=unclassified Bradyrhizobium TaxID=2631580 RepID=UPI002478F941|nr:MULTISPECIES: SDR family oxidoreductase [unclassified Bradyrhizobium]WGR98444.1 SDR family oxidoreductase [Bradyrhizobium sp. ISRA436]WGS05333.1 SDR family oxidoreductase [Bradyrhizobium sp. ISRA437]WGS12219.1 SDR family oxidoreductase [Bradyrhizobium sp. ISRA443]
MDMQGKIALVTAAAADPEELIKAAVTRNPMGRAARPEQIGEVAVFLLSDRASFVTGIAMPVDGGTLA